MSDGREKETPKPYVTPKLTVYGDLRKITEGTTHGSTPDGGSFPKNTTLP